MTATEIMIEFLPGSGVPVLARSPAGRPATPVRVHAVTTRQERTGRLLLAGIATVVALTGMLAGHVEARPMSGAAFGEPLRVRHLNGDPSVSEPDVATVGGRLGEEGAGMPQGAT